MIYLDNAATTFPKPKSVLFSVEECLKCYSANPGRGGHNLAVKASERVFNCRSKCAEFFGAKSVENVIFTSSCTASINTVLKGVLNPGDHVICSSLEHNAVLRPLEGLKSKGINYDIARVFPYDDIATTNSFEALIRSETKLIICTHASNVFGFVMPIEKLSALCKSYDLLFAVDAAQSAGILPLDCEKMGIDFLSIAPHKGLYAPMGTGLLIANKDIEKCLIEGGTGSYSALSEQPQIFPDKFESGTLNLSGIVGIEAGIDFIKRKGLDRIYSAELKLIRKCYSHLSRNKHIVLYSEMPQKGSSVPVLSFNVKGSHSETIGEKLNTLGIATRAGLHCAPLAHKTIGTLSNGTIRISPSAFSSDFEIDYFINKIKFLKN